MYQVKTFLFIQICIYETMRFLSTVVNSSASGVNRITTKKDCTTSYSTIYCCYSLTFTFDNNISDVLVDLFE